MNITKTNCQLPISVLNLPPRDSFIPTPSPNADYTLYKVAKKNYSIEASSVLVQKVKLFTNLEIYEWRHQTEFPITKTKYVSIEANQVDSPQIIALTVFNEHCPYKINRLFEMKLCETIYLLKECLIGFERLIDKFGSFEIHEEMIGINEKGFCRVWINQNFALNSFVEKEVSEYETVHKIVEIIEKRSQESKGSRKLFEKLEECSSFLKMVKEIELFIQNFKILVPSRLALNSRKESSKTDKVNIHVIPPREALNKDSARVSNFKFTNFNSRRNIPQTENRRCTSPSIKRFKSEDKINSLKTSEDETVCTKNNEAKYSNELIVSCQEKSNQEKSNDKSRGSYQNGSGRVWLESSFVMEIEENEERNLSAEKKELSYSVEMIKIDEQLIRTKTGRKLSVGIESEANDFYRFSPQSRRKQSLQAGLLNEVIDYGERRNEEEEEEKLKEHSDSIMKNNGWNSLANLMGGLQEIKELKNSFHEGQEERAHEKEIKLEKLDNIGRRGIAMSILPEEFEEVI